jgi:pyruvyltransferase
LTKKFLENKNISVPEIYGDPGLLISNFYKPKLILELQNKIGIVPHYSNYDKYLNLDTNIYYLINPSDNWKIVIDNLYSCKFIISSSLHGLICSDAYNKPNLWLDEFPLKEGDLKFRDYFMSQGREYLKIKSILDFNEDLLYKDGNKINLDILMNAFPLL